MKTAHSRFLLASLLALTLAPAGWCEFASLEEALPAYESKRDIIPHLGYTLRYNERCEQAEWVTYILTADRLKNNLPRKDDFRSDPKVKTGSATPADYRRSGYDRGHLAPAADMKWSERAMSESFYMSNMSPQVPAFNRGIWSDLEERVRDWARESGSLYVVTGPVLEEGLPEIGENGVAVPKYFYKVLLDYRDPGYKAVGFILPNEEGTHPLDEYAVTVDSVETRTGIDFFPALPAPLEKKLEGSLSPADWGLAGQVLVASADSTAPTGVTLTTVSDTGTAGPVSPAMPPRLMAKRIIAAVVALVIVVLVIWLLFVTIGEATGIIRRKR